MTRKYLPIVLIVSFLALSACAEHKHDSEIYLHKEDNTFRMDDFRMGLVINPTHYTDCDDNELYMILCLFTGSYQKSGYPYTLLVASRYSGETKDTTKILGLKMRIESEQEIDLLGKNQDKIEISYDPPADPASPGTIGLPLGNKLSFWPGQRVAFTMTFQPPNSKEIYTTKYVFEGTTDKFIYTAMDSFLAG